jgi:cytochrome c
MKFASLLFGAALCASLGAAGAQAADAAKGKIVFDKCLQCHHIGLGATNFYGPVLNGLIGRTAGTVPGYKYSEAMEKSGIVWNYDTLSKYLREPKHEVPGINMTFPGLQSQEDIDNVIAYISPYRRDGGQD